MNRDQIIEELNKYLPSNIFAQFTNQSTNHYVELQGGIRRSVLIILFPDITGLYMKLPQAWIDKPKEYLQRLAKRNYYFLLIRDNKYSAPISMNTIINHWKFKMSISAQNENRLQFYGAVSKIQYFELAQAPSLFAPSSIIESISDTSK